MISALKESEKLSIAHIASPRSHNLLIRRIGLTLSDPLPIMSPSTAPHFVSSSTVAEEYNKSNMLRLFVGLSARFNGAVTALYVHDHLPLFSARGATIDVGRGSVRVEGYPGDSARAQRELQSELKRNNLTGVEVKEEKSGVISVSQRHPCGVTTKVCLDVR